MVKGRTQTKGAPVKKIPVVSAKRSASVSTSLSSPAATAVGQRKSSLATSIPSCGGCGVLISDEVKSLQCDRCQGDQWKCIDCLNISADVYDQLISEPACSLKWFCDGCDKTVSCLDTSSIAAAAINSAMDRFSDMLRNMEQNLIARIVTLEQKLNQKADVDEVRAMRDKIQSVPDVAVALDSVANNVKSMESSVSSRLTAVEHSLGQKADLEEVRQISSNIQSATEVRGCIEGALKSQLAEDKNEEREVEQRKTNIIIHGMAESVAETPNERIDNDLLQVAAMLDELKLNEVKVEKVIRLGKRLPVDTDTDKPRPLKVVLDTEDNKVRVIRNAKNLRNAGDGGWVKVFVHQDLTPKQRDARNVLVQELKSRVAQGETDLTIYRGAVVKRRRQ